MGQVTSLKCLPKPSSWTVNIGARVQVNAGPLAHWEAWFKLLDDGAKDKPTSWIVNTGARVQVNTGPLAHWEAWLKLLDD